MSVDLGSVISGLVATAKSDLAAAALPLLATFLNNIAKNPSELNIVAQAALLQAGLIAALPNIEQSILASISTQISALATEAAAKVAPAA